MALVACSNDEEKDNEEIVAKIGDREITLEELRYHFEDNHMKENIDEYIKMQVVMEEVERLDIDMSQKFDAIDESTTTYPEEGDTSKQAEEIRVFSKKQAQKLKVEPEEFYEKYSRKNNEFSAYMVAYFEHVIGKPLEDMDELLKIEDFETIANDALNKLMEEKEAEIEIYL